MEIEALRQKAKVAGIKSYWNKRPEKLLKELGEIEDPVSSESFEVSIDQGQAYLKRISFNLDRLKNAALKMGADKVVYSHMYRKFDLYKNNKHFDNLSIGDYLGE